MAVAAHKGSLSLYALKPMDEIRSAVQAGGSMDERRFQPVKEVSFPTSGKPNSRELGLNFSSGRKDISTLKGKY